MKPIYFRFLGWYVVLVLAITAASAWGWLDKGSDEIYLKNVSWRLERYGRAGHFKQALNEAPVTLAFDFSIKEMRGNSGCNQFAADFSIERDSLKVGPAESTLMACTTEKVMAQEAEFMALFQSVIQYQIKGNHLILLTNTGEQLIFVLEG